MKTFYFLLICTLFLLGCPEGAIHHEGDHYDHSFGGPEGSNVGNAHVASALGQTNRLGTSFELGLDFYGSTSSVNASGYLYIESVCDYPQGTYTVKSVSAGSYNSFSDIFSGVKLKASGPENFSFTLNKGGFVGQEPSLSGRNGKSFETGMWAFVNFPCGTYLIGYGTSASKGFDNAQRDIASLPSYRWLSLLLILSMIFFASLAWFVWNKK